MTSPVDSNKYTELFNYLRGDNLPSPTVETGIVGFGRRDARIAHTAGNLVLALADRVRFIVFTGGTGKDSGGLTVPESDYLKGQLLVSHPRLHVPVYTETEASNGGGNARNSLALMDEEGLPYTDTLAVAAHATSARRLGETLIHEADKRGTPIERLYTVPTDYPFNPANPQDKQEALAEFTRLMEWPERGLLPLQELPQNLVDFVVDRNNADAQGAI